MKKIVLAATALLGLSTAAHAAVMPDLQSVTPDGSNFLFTYAAQLPPDQGLVAGDQLAIIDFAGYVDGTAMASSPDWTVSIVNTLPSGLKVPPGFTDSNSVPDLLFTYTGSDLDTSGGPFPSSTFVTNLSAESTFGLTEQGHFSGSAVKNTGNVAGNVILDVGGVGVPSGVPEPATWAMLLLGFLGIGALARSRKGNATGALAA